MKDSAGRGGAPRSKWDAGGDVTDGKERGSSDQEVTDGGGRWRTVVLQRSVFLLNSHHSCVHSAPAAGSVGPVAMEGFQNSLNAKTSRQVLFHFPEKFATYSRCSIPASFLGFSNGKKNKSFECWCSRSGLVALTGVSPQGRSSLPAASRVGTGVS